MACVGLQIIYTFCNFISISTISIEHLIISLNRNSQKLFFKNVFISVLMSNTGVTDILHEKIFVRVISSISSFFMVPQNISNTSKLSLDQAGMKNARFEVIHE